MPKTVFLDKPADFSFRHTIYSHGWCDLPPFVIDEQNWQLDYVFTCKRSGNSVGAKLSELDGKIKIDLDGSNIDKAGLLKDIRHVLRIDDDLSAFYHLAKKDENLAWVTGINAGRLLRSPTVFEDLVKTICTTNCSWALTKKMVTNLVEKLGEPSKKGRKAFPTAEAMASEEAVKRFPSIVLEKSYVLGDKASDVEFGHRAGCQSVLLKTGYGERVLAGKYQSLDFKPHYICDDLPQAVDTILAQLATANSPV